MKINCIYCNNEIEIKKNSELIADYEKENDCSTLLEILYEEDRDKYDWFIFHDYCPVICEKCDILSHVDQYDELKEYYEREYTND